MDSIEAKIVAFNLFGSHNHYGKNSHEEPPNNPFELQNYPCQDDITKIYFGKVPDFISETLIIHETLGKSFIQMSSGRSLGITGDDLITQTLALNKGKDGFARYGWNITFTIERKINIPLEHIKDNSKYLWLDMGYIGPLSAKFQWECKKYFGELISTLTPTIGEEFLETEIFSYYLIQSDSRAIFTFPNMDGTCYSYSPPPMESFDGEKLQKILDSIQKKDSQDLKSVKHWYLNVLKENDIWKIFLWSFLGLEILSNKYTKNHFHSFIEELQSNNTEHDTSVVSNFLPEKNRMTMNAKFSIMASRLDKENVTSDSETFKDLAKMRNRLAHGEVIQEKDLPYYKARELFYKYYKLAVDKVIF